MIVKKTNCIDVSNKNKYYLLGQRTIKILTCECDNSDIINNINNINNITNINNIFNSIRSCNA